MEYMDLTPAQTNIRDLMGFYGEISIATLCGAVIYDESFKEDDVRSALKTVLEEHTALCLRFRSEGSRMTQYYGEFPDITHKTFASEEDLQRYGQECASKVFSPDGGEMCFFTVFDLQGKTGVLLCASHLVADAATYSIIARDIFRALKGTFVKPSSSYGEVAGRISSYLKSPSYKKDLGYWKDRYSDGFRRTVIKHPGYLEDDAASKRYVFETDKDLSQRIREYSSRTKTSPAAVFESAILFYLHRINGNPEVTCGVPVQGRRGASEKDTAGMFVSTIPLTIRIDTESSDELIRKTYDTHKEIYRHRMLPYSDIVRSVREKSGFEGRLFDILINFQDTKISVPAATKWFYGGFLEVPMAFHIDDRDGNDSYTITVDHRVSVFKDIEEVKLFCDRIIFILEQMTESNKLLSDISILPKNEYALIMDKFNDTSADHDRKVCVHEAFSRIARSEPDRTALKFHGDRYTYEDLDIMSDTLTAILISKGITRGDIVPVIARRSPLVIVAMLAILKSGAAYMPVSPSYPPSRIGLMTKDCKIALTYDFQYDHIDSLRLEDLDLRNGGKVTLPETDPSDICYCIYTSGSTGEPKGTLITHANVMNYCSSNRFNVCDRITGDGIKSIVSVTDIVFDIFVTESWLALLNRIEVILADEEEIISQKSLSALIRENGVDMIQTTPTKMRSFLFDKKDRDYLKTLKAIVLGGEELQGSLVEELRKTTDAKIYNIYGPSETTVWSSLTPVDTDITLGTPVANTGIYILDGDRDLLPTGVMGEIYISGEGVAKGYLNRPDITKERFTEDPFFPARRMYRTGDLGVMRFDGRIIFCGRADGQIKLRGLRIETGEIECAMCEFPGIDLAAVTLSKKEGSEPYLCAFYTSGTDIDEKELRSFLLSRLPSYMVPNMFMNISFMPLTSSGKIDRKALPKPDPGLKDRKIKEPSSDLEKKICELMAEVLRIDKAGSDDDFFEMGGDSFSAMEFVSAAADNGIGISVKQVYENRTPEKICASLGSGAKDPGRVLTRFPLPRTNSDLRFFNRISKLVSGIFRLEVKGIENITYSDRLLFCPNHLSKIDCLVVWCALKGHIDLNDTCALIAGELLDKRISRKIFRVTGGIPIERQGDFRPALNRASEVLRNGKRYLLIHPEGTRSRTGKTGKFKNGAAVVSCEASVPIIPVVIKGTDKILPPGHFLPRLLHKGRRITLSVEFCKPVDPSSGTYDEMTSLIRKRIMELL